MLPAILLREMIQGEIPQILISTSFESPNSWKCGHLEMSDERDGGSELGSRISRREAISTMGKAAIGIAAVAVVGGGSYAAYYYLNQASSQVSEVKLGADLPLSGALGGFGTEAKVAYQLAVDDINSSGGLQLGNKKVPVSLTVYDDKTDSSVATSNVQRLAQVDKVHGLLSITSALTLAAAASAEKYTIPHIGTVGSAAAITQQGYKYTFELYPAAGDQVSYVQNLLGKITGTDQVKTTSILYDNTEVGIEWAKGWRTTAATLGWNVVVDEQYSPHASDYTTYILKLTTAKPDTLAICNQYAPDAINMVKEMKQQNFRPKAFLIGGGSQPGYSTALGQDGDYALLPGNAYAPVEKSTENTNLISRYNAAATAAGAGQPLNVGYEYEQAMILLQGIKSAGTVEPTKVRDAIAATNLSDSLVGPVTFDSTGRAVLRLLLLQWQMQNQVICYPSSDATSQLWYPAPAWSQGEVPAPITIPG